MKLFSIPDISAGIEQRYFPAAFKHIQFLMRAAIIYSSIFFLAIQIGMATPGICQNTDEVSVTLELNNESLKTAFKRIEKQTDFLFAFQPVQIIAYKNINLRKEKRTLTQTLELILKATNLGYRQVNYSIIIFEKNASVKSASESSVIKIETENASIITGRVTDHNGDPVAKATIAIKGTNRKTATGDDGSFSIEADKTDVLVITFVGFVSQEIAVGNSTLLTVQLTPSNNNTLGDVVVVGYGSQKKAKVTGAIASITSKDINGVAVTGLDQALQGKVSGVQVTQNSAEPGGSVSIRIRGIGSINQTNEPLYIVDGVPYGSLNAINPNDIERIDVLKDAAAASIYGSRASNGVVLVTTKHAKKGLVISVDAYAGAQSVAKKLELLNGPQFAKLANENLVNGGIAPNAAWSNPSTVQSNDWQSAVFQTAPIQNYNVSIASGGDKSSSFFSLGYFRQGGIIIGSDYERYTARLNTDYAISKKLKVGIVLNGAFDKKQNVGSANDFGGVLNQALYMQPTSPIKTDQNGLFGLNADGSVDLTGNSFFGWNGYAFYFKICQC